MKRTAIALLACVLATPASAGYPEARASFQNLTPDARAAVALGLIASGDFEGLAVHGYSLRLYRAVRDFEEREGFDNDGILDSEQLQRLSELATAFEERLGVRHYTHPDMAAKLLIPRGLFDAEQQTPDGLLFTRRDGGMSLVFVSFRNDQKSYDALWSTLSRGGDGKKVIYQRRFDQRFVVTGVFGQSKFYTMMARTGASTTGFTFSWGAPYENLGRKVSTFLANAWLAELR